MIKLGKLDIIFEIIAIFMVIIGLLISKELIYVSIIPLLISIFINLYSRGDAYDWRVINGNWSPRNNLIHSCTSITATHLYNYPGNLLGYKIRIDWTCMVGFRNLILPHHNRNIRSISIKRSCLICIVYNLIIVCNH